MTVEKKSVEAMNCHLFAGHDPIPWSLDLLSVFLLTRLHWSLHALCGKLHLLFALDLPEQFLGSPLAKTGGHKKLPLACAWIAHVVAVCH